MKNIIFHEQIKE